ncbi:calcium-binding protein [Rhizobium herbae]|uniref:Calcium-binding protein n=1 Tax=Rhizobium herbae TaxID=508661 RepID=A0ABS7HGT3_9HYPH|nr:calcium-binding protein [Rhizobium herbae]MBW9066124.1 calcium-binding protein [Rhizobium herbae]
MAKIAYRNTSRGVDMLAPNVSGLSEYAQASWSTIEIKVFHDSSNYTLFEGTGLKVSSTSGQITDITAGIVNTIKLVIGGTTISSMTGLNVSAAKLADAIFAENDAAFLSLILSGNDTVYGTNHNDTLVGGSGNDTLHGNGGNDWLLGGAGADKLVGGLGYDAADYDLATKGVVASLVNNSINTNDALGDTYTSVEDLLGSRYGDKLYGNNNDNFLWGREGNDLLDGGRGNDYLLGGAGADKLHGGAGYDLAYYANATKGVTASLVNSSINTNDAKGDTYVSIENLEGSDYADNLYGNSEWNRLWGLDGNDIINGAAGGDMIFGGAGADDLTGGAGKDVFAFSDVSDSTVSASGRDTIFDFSGAGGDKIELDEIDANIGLSGDQAFHFIGTAAFSGKAGELRYDKMASDTYIYADLDGDSTADFSIHLDDLVNLSKGSFFL